MLHHLSIHPELLISQLTPMPLLPSYQRYIFLSLDITEYHLCNTRVAHSKLNVLTITYESNLSMTECLSHVWENILNE